MINQLLDETYLSEENFPEMIWTENPAVRLYGPYFNAFFFRGLKKGEMTPFILRPSEKVISSKETLIEFINENLSFIENITIRSIVSPKREMFPVIGEDDSELFKQHFPKEFEAYSRDRNLTTLILKVIKN